MPLKDSVTLKCFNNQLRFNELELNNYYKSLENHWRMTLVEAVQLLSERAEIGDFEKLVSLNVVNLSSPEYPEVVSIYKNQGEKDLILIEAGKSTTTCSVYARAVENGIYFFLTDSKEIEFFSNIFETQDQSCFFDFNRLKLFSFYKEGSMKYLYFVDNDGTHYKF